MIGVRVFCLRYSQKLVKKKKKKNLCGVGGKKVKEMTSIKKGKKKKKIYWREKLYQSRNMGNQSTSINFRHFLPEKEQNISPKQLSKMSLLRECETEYRSEKGLPSSNSETRTYTQVTSIVFDMKWSKSRPIEQFYDQKVWSQKIERKVVEYCPFSQV